MYIIRSFMKIAEIDNFVAGCDMESTAISECCIEIKADTIDVLKDKIPAYFGVDSNSVGYNACEELGRVDIQILEDEHGNKAGRVDLGRWKKGKIDLYTCTYIGQLERLEKVSF